jgi:predicted short-subunit dehydrogenase-like oxidoreductase (DUF2520 family)
VSRPCLHVLGAGRAARVLARWLVESGLVELGQVCNQSLASAEQAVEFMGSGKAVESLDESLTGGWLLMGLPDSQIAPVATGLSMRMPGQPEIAFHLSGAMPALALSPLEAPAASLHPVRAFADPERALKAMPGTRIVAEGDAAALALLKPVLIEAGARWVELGNSDKTLYHAATVSASNFLVTLTGMARELAQAAGIEPREADQLLADLQRSTLDNLADRGAAAALTGPIERADVAACERLVGQIRAFGSRHESLFLAMARATLELAVQGRGPRAADEELRRLFS